MYKNSFRSILLIRTNIIHNFKQHHLHAWRVVEERLSNFSFSAWSQALRTADPTRKWLRKEPRLDGFRLLHNLWKHGHCKDKTSRFAGVICRTDREKTMGQKTHDQNQNITMSPQGERLSDTSQAFGSSIQAPNLRVTWVHGLCFSCFQGLLHLFFFNLLQGFWNPYLETTSLDFYMSFWVVCFRKVCDRHNHNEEKELLATLYQHTTWQGLKHTRRDRVHKPRNVSSYGAIHLYYCVIIIIRMAKNTSSSFIRKKMMEDCGRMSQVLSQTWFPGYLVSL